MGEARGVPATVRVGVSALCGGMVVGLIRSFYGTWQYAMLIGWMFAAAVFVTRIWIIIGSMDAPTTATHAVRVDPGRAVIDASVVAAAVASLARWFSSRRV
jgi:uncharacterized membrane protein